MPAMFIGLLTLSHLLSNENMYSDPTLAFFLLNVGLIYLMIPAMLLYYNQKPEWHFVLTPALFTFAYFYIFPFLSL